MEIMFDVLLRKLEEVLAGTVSLDLDEVLVFTVLSIAVDLILYLVAIFGSTGAIVEAHLLFHAIDIIINEALNVDIFGPFCCCCCN